MRLRRALAGAVALAAAGTLPAYAGTGGCAGSPDIPPTYYCVYVYPENAPVPTVEPGGSVPVYVPTVCYVVGCSGGTTVYVPLVSVGGGGTGGPLVTVEPGGGTGEPPIGPIDVDEVVAAVRELRWVVREAVDQVVCDLTCQISLSR